MSSCCEEKSCATDALALRQRRTLWIVLAINAVMFAAELAAGIAADSQALTGDSLDMLGDSIAYGASLAAVGQGLRTKAKVAALKGWIIGLMSAFALGSAIYRTFFQAMPSAALMGGIGFVALVANLTCLGLLWRHRSDDLNMRSVWLCSCNDIIANASVLAAAALVVTTDSRWPDLIVGIGLTVLFARSAWSVLKESRAALKRSGEQVTTAAPGRPT